MNHDEMRRAIRRSTNIACAWMALVFTVMTGAVFYIARYVH